MISAKDKGKKSDVDDKTVYLKFDVGLDVASSGRLEWIRSSAISSPIYDGSTLIKIVTFSSRGLALMYE